mgnify:CR=1 FL=1
MFAYAEAHPECVTEEQPYVAPTPTQEELAASIRAERDRRIAATDYLVMPDYPLDTDKLEEIKTYRQALRDSSSATGLSLWGWTLTIRSVHGLCRTVICKNLRYG